jgi:hypothetical protein
MPLNIVIVVLGGGGAVSKCYDFVEFMQAISDLEGCCFPF